MNPDSSRPRTCLLPTTLRFRWHRRSNCQPSATGYHGPPNGLIPASFGWCSFCGLLLACLYGCGEPSSGVPDEYRQMDRSGESAEKELIQMPQET